MATNFKLSLISNYSNYSNCLLGFKFIIMSIHLGTYYARLNYFNFIFVVNIFTFSLCLGRDFYFLISFVRINIYSDFGSTKMVENEYSANY